MKNSDVFNIVAFEVFHRCSDSFPIPAELSTNEIAQDVFGYFDMSDNESILAEQVDKVFDVVNYATDWLITEGFLQDRGSSDDGFVVTFTLQGLNAVNKTPHSIEAQSSFKDVFINGLAGMPFATAAGLMVELFKGGN